MKVLSIDFINECINKLNEAQTKLFKDYGLRQIKWMFENDPVMQSKVPEGSVLVGLSQPFGRWTALDKENKIRYGYFKGQDPEWSEANNYGNVSRFDYLSDLKHVYDTFKLADHDLSVLTYVHINYLERTNGKYLC